MQKRGLVISALLVCIFIFFSCASTPKESPESVSTAVPAPQKTSRSYFSSIPSRIMDLAESASPEELRQVASKIHKSVMDDYTENEAVLLVTCSEIMKIVWPSESFQWDVPSSVVTNPYTGAMDSARRGIFDSSTGNTDFLTVVLPSLVLVTSPSRTDFLDLCETSLAQALEMKPSSVLANYLEGLLRLRQNRGAEASTYFTRCLGFAPDVFELNYALALSKKMSGNYTAALELGNRLLERMPQNIPVLELCAESAYAMNDLDSAESYILRVLLLEPENLRYVLFRAGILISKGDYIRASSLLDMYSKNDVTSKEYLLLRARMQRDWNKNNAAAGETIGLALSLYPEDTEVLLFAAEIASAANINVGGNSAMEIAQRVLSRETDNVSAMRICVSEYIKKQDWQSAYTLSSKIVSKPDVLNESVYEHVDICLALSKNEEAMNFASRMYTSSASDENAQQAYIKVLVRTGQKTLAGQLIAQMLTSAAPKMKSFLYYQRSFLASSDDAALGDLRSSLTANPRNKDALYRLYEIYYSKKDWRRAQYYLKQVVALDPTNSSVLRKNSELDSLLGK